MHLISSRTNTLVMVDQLNVFQLIVADLVSAITASACVAPFVACCDKAIAEAAAGKTTAWSSCKISAKKMFASPVRFFNSPASRYLWVMYAGTYAAANLFTSYNDVQKTHTPFLKTTGIFAVNTGLSLWKDSAFAKMFSSIPPAPVPKPALFSWYFRDFIGMGVIFVAPPIMASHMKSATGLGETVCQTSVQFSLPLLVQPIVAPFHLYGYVLYNYPSSSMTQQLKMMRQGMWGAVQMRLSRCVAPYSLGTNINRELRSFLFRAGNEVYNKRGTR